MRPAPLLAMITLLLAATASSQAPAPHKPGHAAIPPRKPELTTLMYLIDSPASIASFRDHADEISVVAPQSFSMDAEGFIGGEVPPAVLAVAAEKHVAVMPLVVNRRFNQPLMHTVLDNAASRARAIRYLLYYALRDGYIGFQFDYENIHYDYQNRFTLFFAEAAREFHRHSLLLSIAVVGKYGDERTPGYDNWSGVYDYAALGRDADFVSVMAYSQHDIGTGPGPMAGLPWVQRIADYSLHQLPARKVSLGLPLYGFQWTAVAPPAPFPANSTATADAKPDVAVASAKPPARKWTGHSYRYSDLAPRMEHATVTWDEVEQATHGSFNDAGAQNDIWWEDARSLAAKVELATQLHLAGISAWVLGAEDPAFWKVLEQYRIRHPHVPAVNGTVEERARAAARKLGH